MSENPARFVYKYNIGNLLNGLICLGGGALFLFYGMVIISSVNVWSAIYGAGCFLISFLFLWLAKYFISTYFKLRGKVREILMYEGYMVFPVLGDSLELLRLNYSDITDIYQAEGRYGIPDNLIIKHHFDGHAYIAKSSLSYEDFEEICSLLKKYLVVSKIKVRRA